MNPTLTLASQPTAVLVALFRQLKCPVDLTNNITPGALTLIQVLHKRGFPLKELL